MDDQNRKKIMKILEEHGYLEFSPDPTVVRACVPQNFGEGVAVHPNEGGTFSLWVRWQGSYKEKTLKDLARDLGARMESPAAVFPELDLRGIDETVGKVVGWLRHHAQLE